MKYIKAMFVLLFLTVPALALAQDGGGAVVGGVLGEVLKFAFGATGIMLISQALLSAGLAGVVPAWLKPLIGPVLGVAASLLSQFVGFLPNFDPIMGVLLGTAAANLFGVAKGAKVLKSTG